MNDRLRELLRETVKCIGDNMDVAGTEWQDAPMKTWMQKWEAALASQPSDLKAKLESLRGSIRSNYECNRKDGHTEAADAQEAIYYELTAILEGKD